MKFIGIALIWVEINNFLLNTAFFKQVSYIDWIMIYQNLSDDRKVSHSIPQMITIIKVRYELCLWFSDILVKCLAGPINTHLLSNSFAHSWYQLTVILLVHVAQLNEFLPSRTWQSRIFWVYNEAMVVDYLFLGFNDFNNYLSFSINVSPVCSTPDL